VHRHEILRLSQKVQEKGLTLVPLKVYFKRGWAKMEVGVARGKKQYDRRQAIKERDLQRALRRGEQ
jgi:SsrA-binding protein